MEPQSVSQQSEYDSERVETYSAEGTVLADSVHPDTEILAESGSPLASGLDPEKARQLAENLEKMVALNLENSGLGGSRFSRPLLQLASALAGLASLFLMYCCTRLMY